jgi:hypothetical protein
VTAALFETVRVEGGRIRLRDRHLARLRASGVSQDRLATVERLMDGLCAGTAVVVARLVVGEEIRAETRRPGAREPVGLVPVAGYDPGLRRRERKLLDRTWATALEALAGAGEEPLLVSPNGLAGETTRANVFAVVGGRLVTPPARGLLPGVTRSWVIEQTGAVEEELTTAELLAAEVAFLTTAGRGVVPVAGTDSGLADELARAWDAL